MTGQLVTVATFDQPAEAHVAKNVLETAGIRAVVTDEQTAGMLWAIAPALSGAKVQVMEGDAERALAILEKELGADGGDEVDPEQLAAEAEAAAPEEGVGPPPAPTPAPPADAERLPSERDGYAQWFVLVACFGLAIPLVWFYAFYLFLNAAFGAGELSERGKFQVRLGGVLLAVGAVTGFLASRALLLALGATMS
jgi:hypothetical protein